jgi:hypothetical protein
MPALSGNSGHHESDQEKALKPAFSKEDQAVLKERLSQGEFRQFENALHVKARSDRGASRRMEVASGALVVSSRSEVI